MYRYIVLNIVLLIYAVNITEHAINLVYSLTKFNTDYNILLLSFSNDNKIKCTKTDLKILTSAELGR